jgi:lysophospholipase L1-like esterase
VRRRHVAGIVAGALLLPLVVLGADVEIARRGPAPGPAPEGRDGCVGCSGTPGETVQRVVWLGDSTAAGIGVGRADDVLGQQVARLVGRPTAITNLAVSGATIADVLDEQVPRVAATRADVVAISIGANDVTHRTTTATFRKRYRRLLAALPEGIPVVVLGVPDMGSPPRLAQPLRAITGFLGRKLDRVARDEAHRAGATYVDIAGPTGPRFRADHGLFAGDRYHPSAAGYGLWAEEVARTWPAR